ncbi:cytochrome c [Phenylobacterium hankyongense]|uniref:cytochrome c n=1 Tax=Phenylobacterium hankyongense TaxID=1813876 RepID=UPI001403B099|nr:cytochrome c [Phenylobacterium hankyongense]
MKRLMMLAACAGLLSGCAPPKPAPPPAGAAKFATGLPMAELMGHVVDPAAFAYWQGSGTEITDKGERDLSPTTQEGWERLENGAATLIEAGNLLQLPGRIRAPEADWNRYAQALTARATEAKAAAENHDKQAVFDAGGRVYEVCTACHKQYVIDPQLKAEGGEPPGKLPDWNAPTSAPAPTAKP